MFPKNLSLLLFFCFLTLSAQSKADRILGNWLATDKSVAVEVYKLKGVYKAKVLWFDESRGSGKPMHTRLDSQNPNQNLQKRKIIGMEVLEGLVYNAKNQTWENGKIYDASSGRLWDSTVNLEDNMLKVRGYWKLKWIGKTMIFKKTEQPKYTKR